MKVVNEVIAGKWFAIGGSFYHVDWAGDLKAKKSRDMTRRTA